MRALQITRFGGPEGLDVVGLPDPVPGDGEQLCLGSSAGVNFADSIANGVLSRLCEAAVS